jgi:hypothetical protein
MIRTMKIVGATAVVTAMLVGGGAVVAAAPVEVTICAPGEPAPDSDFTAGISIGEVADFDGCYYDVTFDAAVLRLDDVTPGLIGSTTISVETYWEVSPGSWRVVQSLPGATGVTGSGYLAVLHFHVIGSDGDSSAISLSDGSLYDTLAEEIAATWVGDSVDVVSLDTKPPAIVSVSPVNGATGVAADTAVTAAFSDAMDAATIITSSFTLVAGDTPVSGSVSYNSYTHTATFTPDANLAYDGTYTATLSTAITDAAGNPLNSAYSWNFSIICCVPSVIVSIYAPTTATPDSSFRATLYIRALNAPSLLDFDMNSCSYDVTFDASVLELDDVTPGLIGSTVIPVDSYSEVSPGTYRVVQSIPALTEATNLGYLTVLHFHVIGSEGDSSNIRLSNAVILNGSGEETEAGWWHGSVDINPLLPGDANGDGIINALDITAVERIITWLDTPTTGADTNQDGTINALDITATERALAGLD